MSGLLEYGPELDIYIVRHGHSAANEERVMQGWADYPLSDLGIEQARNAGRYLAMSGVPVKAIYASPLSRARRTAEEIAVRFRPALDVITVDELKEISIGSLTDTPIKQAEIEHPKFFEERRAEMVGFDKFGGESMEAFTERVLNGLKIVFENHVDGDSIVITGHGGSNLVMLKLLFGFKGIHRFLKLHNCFIAKVIRRFINGAYISKLDFFLSPEQQRLMVEGLKMTRGLVEED